MTVESEALYKIGRIIGVVFVIVPLLVLASFVIFLPNIMSKGK